MIRALYSAASGMNAQQLNVDNIANNLANANTAGYKARRAQFQDLLYQNMVQPGAASSQQSTVPTGLQLGLGTRAASNEIIFTQGNSTETDNPLDVVIQGNGFFQIRLASYRTARVHARRPIPARPQRQLRHLQRRHAGTADYHPFRRAIHHHRQRRHGELSAARADLRAKGRPDPAWRISESGRPEQHRQ